MKRGMAIAIICVIVGLIIITIGTVIATKKNEVPAETETVTEAITEEATPTEVETETEVETVEVRIYENPGNHPIGDDAIPTHSSLTLEQLQNDCMMPKSFTRTVFKGEEKVVEEFANFLPTDNFNAIVIELYPYENITIKSSAIEDGMIYTLCDVAKKDGTVAEMLLINHPETLQFVAASWTTDNYDGYSHYEYRY